MNNIYLYDGSFDSLINLIYTLIDNNIIPNDIKNDEYNNLIDNFIYLKDLKEYKNTLSNELMYIIYKVYLSNDERKELILYYFIKNALIYKDKILDYKYLNCVLHVLRINKNVSSEAHKLKGFLRFKELKNNVFYAEMSPKNNVIFLLAEHFKKRLSNEYFLIKDTGRNIYAFYDKTNIMYLNDEDIKDLNLNINDNELEIESLWKSFFNTIGIKERKNYKTQRNFMPKRYWKYMIEMEDKL
jgi:probable DNA metabolism protein